MQFRSTLPSPPAFSLPLLGACALLLACLLLVPSGIAAAESFQLGGLRGGERLTDAELGHGVTLVVVWASWSPRSRDIVARINPLAERFGSRAKLISVNFQEDRSVVEKFLAGKSLSVPVFLDSEGLFSKAYSVATLPGLLIVKEGRVVYNGKLPEDPDRVILEALK